MAASVLFGAPWPGPLLHRVAVVILAIPVLFVVGAPILDSAGRQLRQRRPGADLLVSALALAGWGAGLLALVAPVRGLAGPATLLMAGWLTLRSR